MDKALDGVMISGAICVGDCRAMSTRFSEAFQLRQQPEAWLISALNLRRSANIIVEHQRGHDIAFGRALFRATIQAPAVSGAGSDGIDVEIDCEPPDYTAAYMLSGFAMENALKGIIYARNPEFVDAGKLKRVVTNHDLVKLAQTARFECQNLEGRALEMLTKVIEWAGRYPVALIAERQNFDISMVSWGFSPVVDLCLARMIEELERLIGENIENNPPIIHVRDI
ncbi:hypothetical protein [Azorhizobium caulinodans]|uniref:hypothetical protein n=1 Tax=Azorhizobium caulinodans TaxID=7 RepID=UPI0011D171AB|nr:hypothetical protein [Azorhizobium caulinodans]